MLAYVLVDTPRVATRAAVLSTCFILHDLGLPILYRVVNVVTIANSQSCIRLDRHLAALFGEDGGMLTTSGRRPNLGRSVFELRIGRTDWPQKGWKGIVPIAPGVVCGQIDLPNCTTVTLCHATYTQNVVKDILPRLPVVDFTFVHHDYTKAKADTPMTGYRAPDTLAGMLGMPTQPWPNLRRITFDGYVWYDHLSRSSQMDGTGRRLSFADWSFKHLVIDLLDWEPPRADAGFGSDPTGPGELYRLLLCPPKDDGLSFLEDVERIELRLPAGMVRGFQREMEAVRRDKPEEPVRERLLRSIVFVGRDGEERRLVQSVE